KANRNFFIKTLTTNIQNILKNYDVKIKKDRVRMFIEANDNILLEVLEKLKKEIGLHGITICYKVNTNKEEIKNLSLDIINKEKGKTYKVITKRADKNFSISSMEFNNVIGGHILKNTNLKVDVHNPDINLYIEIRDNGTYIYT